jgi:asparagine synthase (glutamine-hydrolysing)
VAFHGNIANKRELGSSLGIASHDLAMLYGGAVARWGAEADKHIVGEYCAILFDPGERSVRLSRSPLRAPPLYYFHDREQVTAASVPRALFAAGVPCRLDERHLADANWANFSDETASWYEDLSRVPLGTIVSLSPRAVKVERYYDVMSLPDVRLGSDAEYLARAGELLDEGVRAALEGANRPGVALSSGLDSPQVAVRALRMLRPKQRLPSFTFVPEPEWDGIVEDGMVGNEADAVRAFAAMHPRLDPYFTDNAGSAHDQRWNDMFHAMGGAPQGLCNMYPFHGIWRLAQQQGCDRLLLAEWGNLTFSARGEWGCAEYLAKGRWRQLYRALRDHPNDPRSLPRRFAALSLAPWLPDRLWRLLTQAWHRHEKPVLELLSPLSAEFRSRMDVEARARGAGLNANRFHARNRRHERRMQFSAGEGEIADTYQAFEQLYGVEQRDPTAYRPFVEFCLGLPTEMFLRDGEYRWLAKQLARGIMPEEQRANRKNGRWDADWHLRIGRRRPEWLHELDRVAKNPRLAGMLDVPRLRKALEDFPPHTVTDRQQWVPIEMAVPRGLLAARFVTWLEGSNAP